MAKSETEAQLRKRILAALMRDVGISEKMARPFVDSVMACFAGGRPYFPIEPRGPYPVHEIRAALESGLSVKRVMREFHVSRSTLHRLFPGGLPRLLDGGLSQVLPKAETN